MKQVNFKRFFGLMLAVGALGVLTTSCGKEGCTDPTASNYDADAERYDGSCEYANSRQFVVTPFTVGSVNYKSIEGNINENFTMDAGTNWMISGGVFVTNNATLTVEAGVTITAKPEGATDFLVISQGAKIMAEGTCDNPIVMTSLDESKGSWGGLVVNGYGDINNGTTAEAECGSGTYGGSDDADNSGIIRYVRVEYAGLICATDDELNGITFNAVGSGTTVEYLQAYKCADDGLEFFGGQVSVKWAVSAGAGDDSFDWTHGWRGNGQYWVVHQDNIGGDRGFEADNNGDDNSATPFSQPKIANVTIVNDDDGDQENTGMRLREGTKGDLMNCIIVNSPNNGVRVSNQVTTDNMNNGELNMTHSVVFDAGTPFKDCAVFENDPTNSNADPALTGFTGIVTGGGDPSAWDAWFDATNYKGAVDPANDWTNCAWHRAL